MKKISLAVLFAFLAITAWSLKNPISPKELYQTKAPGDAVFIFFNAHRAGKMAIDLMWRVAPGSGVVSFQIEKSYDGEFFDPLAASPNTHGANCFWKDTNVFPGYLYYRVAAIMSNGDMLYSAVQMVHIFQR